MALTSGIAATVIERDESCDYCDWEGTTDVGSDGPLICGFECPDCDAWNDRSDLLEPDPDDLRDARLDSYDY